MSKEKETNGRPQRGGEILLIELEKVDIIDGWNERVDYGDMDELARNIQANGVRIALRGHLDRESGKYLITSGHRRLKALQMLAKKGIEVRVPIISDARESEEERLLGQITDNSGKKFNPIEESAVINRLIKYGYSESEVSTKTGFSKVYISNLKLLNSAPKKIKNLITDNVLKSTLAMKILREEKDFNKALEVIENAIESASIDNGGNKKKITDKNVRKSKGQVNSYAELKKTFKQAEKKGLVPRQDKIDLFRFAKSINDGEYSFNFFVSEFFEPEVVKEKEPKKLKKEKSVQTEIPVEEA